MQSKDLFLSFLKKKKAPVIKQILLSSVDNKTI